MGFGFLSLWSSLNRNHEYDHLSSPKFGFLCLEVCEPWWRLSQWTSMFLGYWVGDSVGECIPRCLIMSESIGLVPIFFFSLTFTLSLYLCQPLDSQFFFFLFLRFTFSSLPFYPYCFFFVIASRRAGPVLHVARPGPFSLCNPTRYRADSYKIGGSPKSSFNTSNQIENPNSLSRVRIP